MERSAAIEALEILSAGPMASVQDLGRYGFCRHGVAPSGAVDSYALRIANLLTGNPQNEAAIEITLTGFSVRILTDLVAAVTGGDLQPRLNKQPLEMWRSHHLRAGDILSLRGPKSGCRAYLALGGRMQIPTVLGSKSTNLAAAFGGFRGRPLRDGDIVSLEKFSTPQAVGQKGLPPKMIPVYQREWTLRILWGPQDDQFSESARKSFLGKSFRVLPQSNRVGIRLEGPVIGRKLDLQESIISEGVVAGTIQVPANGQPIIILGETVTGGYRKIATVIAADLPLLGQIKPGNRVSFQSVSVETAHQALKDTEEKIQELQSTLLLMS